MHNYQSKGRPMFECNGSLKDLTQVEPYFAEFAALKEAENLFYNSDFEGRIPGIANTEKRGPNVGTHEQAAIYMLQTLYRQRKQDEKVAALLAEGFERIEKLDETTRFQRVILFSDDLTHFRGEWNEWESARVVPNDYGD